MSTQNLLEVYLIRSQKNHKNEILQLQTLKEACIYCVINNISPQRYGYLIELFIREKFHYIKNNSTDCNGDCIKDGHNTEIKVSLGSTRNKFNFVQIRPLHNCDVYIFVVYHLSFSNVDQEGELYVFKIPKLDMKNILISHGCYAHGTVKQHGKITIDSLNNTKEYALRPILNDKCWNTLQSFRIDENEI